jgi:hypothetical protein
MNITDVTVCIRSSRFVKQPSPGTPFKNTKKLEELINNWNRINNQRAAEHTAGDTGDAI